MNITQGFCLKEGGVLVPPPLLPGNFRSYRARSGIFSGGYLHRALQGVPPPPKQDKLIKNSSILLLRKRFRHTHIIVDVNFGTTLCAGEGASSFPAHPLGPPKQPIAPPCFSVSLPKILAQKKPCTYIVAFLWFPVHAAVVHVHVGQINH